MAEAFELIAPIALPAIADAVKRLLITDGEKKKDMNTVIPAETIVKHKGQHAATGSGLSFVHRPLGKSKGRRRGKGTTSANVANFPGEVCFEVWLGFEITIGGTAPTGFSQTIDAGLIAGFVARFSHVFRNWRMTAWDCLMSADDNTPSNGICIFTPFDADNTLAPSAPSSIAQAYERNGFKTMSMNPSNARSISQRVSWRCRDVDSLLFQVTSATHQYSSSTGVGGYIDSASSWQLIMAGRVLLQFKDLIVY